jgi:hypothetical protein
MKWRDRRQSKHLVDLRSGDPVENAKKRLRSMHPRLPYQGEQTDRDIDYAQEARYGEYQKPRSHFRGKYSK